MADGDMRPTECLGMVNGRSRSSTCPTDRNTRLHFSRERIPMRDRARKDSRTSREGVLSGRRRMSVRERATVFRAPSASAGS